MGALITTNIGASFGEPVRRRSNFSRLGWLVGLVVIGGMGVSVLLPSLCGAREPANRIKCASNLRQIAQAIALYAHQNGGQYPPSLAILIRQENVSPAVMVCPSSNDQKALAADTEGVVADLEAAETNAPGHEHCLSYVYVGNHLNVATALPTTIVAYEPLDNHGGKGTNVLCGDGHVEFIDKTSWDKISWQNRATAAAGISVVPSLTTQP